ncbi:uncharacterized protein LOC115257818 [Aedes albopictus]|uniref:HTH CENPB-type domain-containing protein n=1 Tax=Aedes albopictus TaxID=7160 RepID=A0ABM1YTL6_AEDAL
MVRNYIRKTTRRAWTVTQLTGAIRDVRSGQSTNSVCQKYAIPKRTLRRYLEKQGGTKGNVVLPHLGNFVPIFDEEQEDRLVGIIIRMSDCGYGLTSKVVRSLAFQFAETNNITHPFDMEKQHAGLGWFIGFRRRHPNLALRTPEKTSMARSTGFNRAAVNVFYDNLERIYGSSVYSPDRIWNADETGFSTVPNKSSKVLAVKGRRQVGAISSAERGVNTTVMMTVSAAGQYLPPMFIFPRQRMNDALKIGAPAGSIFECNPSGWSTVSTCTKWFDHFLAYARPTAEAPVLLILDGHSSHTKNVEMIEKAARNNVRILSIPPHTSHKLQPLDVSVMGPLKTKYGQAVDRLLRREPGRVVTVYDVATLVNEAFEATATMKNAVAGFRATGIHPFDTGLFSDADFAAATNLIASNRTADKNVQTEAIKPTPSTAAQFITFSMCENNSYMTTQDKPGHDDLIQVNGCELLQFEIPHQERNEPEFGWEVSGDSEFLTVDPNVYYTVEKNGAVTIQRLEATELNELLTLEEQQLDTNRNSVSLIDHAARDGPDTTKVTKFELSPEPVGPAPVARKRKSQKRKGEQSEELTSTAYRERLLKQSAEKEVKNIKKGQRRNKRKKADTNTDTDVLCPSCGVRFSDSIDGRGWMMCLKCRVWYHSECGSNDEMMCEACS